jgi:archaellum biogenesis protein FlaJ (TadC family)
MKISREICHVIDGLRVSSKIKNIMSRDDFFLAFVKRLGWREAGKGA